MIRTPALSSLSGALSLVLLLAPDISSAQTAPTGKRTWPLTRPEATSHLETSRYDDVLSFMKAMAAASPRIHLSTYGYTHEGRAMPLAVIGAPDASPRSVLATGKTRVFLQGNIHAGEVEGKEALLQLLRSIAKGERDDWFRHVVLLITPIYNADGNERVSVANRGAQHGPLGGMGTRPNAQGLNLNRDAMKMETPEGRSLARFLNQYDPHISVDLHTTNGSDHGYYLTYDGPGSPNTSAGINRPPAAATLPRGHPGGEGEARLGFLLLRAPPRAEASGPGTATSTSTSLATPTPTSACAIASAFFRRPTRTPPSRTGSRRPPASSRKS